MMDTQDVAPKVAKDLDRVGVTGLRTLVKTKWGDNTYTFVPRIQLTVDLPRQRKGAHMSRLIEAITESIEEESEKIYSSLELLEKRIVENLSKKHPLTKAEITFETELVVNRKTPKTGRNTMETHDVSVTVVKGEDGFRKSLKVTVLGNTACPHAMENAQGRTHIQRAICELIVTSDIDVKIPLEDMIIVCEESFSSPVYTLLKTPDETEVVNAMHDNPKFVEDVARDVLDKSRTRFKGVNVRVKVTSEESIHRHNVIAEGEIDS
ncbi:GTP cyclohydrolase, FolE2/MptA family [Candidatus Altiarchaeota archaeon]